LAWRATDAAMLLVGATADWRLAFLLVAAQVGLAGLAVGALLLRRRRALAG